MNSEFRVVGNFFIGIVTFSPSCSCMCEKCWRGEKELLTSIMFSSRKQFLSMKMRNNLGSLIFSPFHYSIITTVCIKHFTIRVCQCAYSHKYTFIHSPYVCIYILLPVELFQFSSFCGLISMNRSHYTHLNYIL